MNSNNYSVSVQGKKTFDDILSVSPYKDPQSLFMLKAVIETIEAFTKRTRKKNLNILDIGCGIGGVSIPLSALGHNVIYSDVDLQSVRRCKKENHFSQNGYVVADGMNLALRKKFDIVIMTGVLEHVFHPYKILENVKRLTAHGGIIIINIPNGFSPYELLFSRFASKVRLTHWFHRISSSRYYKLTGSNTPYHSMNIFSDHLHFFTWRRFHNLLDRHGFQIQDVINIGLGLFLDWKVFHPLKKLECLLGSHVPKQFAGSWNVTVTVKDTV